MSQIKNVGREDLSDLVVDRNGEFCLAKLVRWLFMVEDRVAMSLPAHLKRAIVESRVFVTREAAQLEDVINDVLYGINVMYAGWCMTALSMNHMVGGSKIRDILSTVATESLEKEVFNRSEDLFADIGSFRQRKVPAALSSSGVIPSADTDDLDNGDKISGADAPKNRIVEGPKEFRLTSGIVIDVSYNVGEGRSATKVSVPLAVRLNPTVITSEVAKQFFASNFKLDTWMRMFKVKTGEISFWKDFMFELDLMSDKYKAIKNDRTGTLKELYDGQDNALSSYLLKLVGWRADRQNIASAIHIFTKEQFADYCRATHCHFDNANDRLKYFRSTLSMIVAVIDSEYESVDMYFAGVGNKAHYSYTQMRAATKPNQMDLTSVMRAFANTNPPRF